MRFLKRQTNPIFVEEEQYNWSEKRGNGVKLVLTLLVMGIIVAAVYAQM